MAGQTKLGKKREDKGREGRRDRKEGKPGKRKTERKGKSE